MKIAFVTEMGFEGKVSSNHPNMRTEFAWMHALDADHYPIQQFETIQDYDHVFIIFPKGRVFLNAFADNLSPKSLNPVTGLLSSSISARLKIKNKKVHFVQEGPHWLWNDYELPDQINFFNLVSACDSIFAHNEHDAIYYKGLFQDTPVHVIDTLMIHELIKDIVPTAQEQTIIGGNCARWYGGFESFIVANEFKVRICGQSSHAQRAGEDQMFSHLPRLMWVEWMRILSTFKYAVHLMPTVAAGTFSLNCAYFGIPCIGNREVNTQKLCHPALSVDVNDIQQARLYAKKLKEDQSFYEDCSWTAKNNYKLHYGIDDWKQKMFGILNG